MTSTAPRTPSKFFQEDVVRRKKSPHELGVVLRCWHDSEDYPPLPHPVDPLLRPLQPGEVGVSFFPSHSREILPESEFELVDRLFQPGDVCKRDLQSVKAGVIVACDVEAMLEHAVTGVPLEGWVPSSALEPANDVFVGDFVVLDDWIGQIEEIFDEAIVQLSAGGLVRVPQLGGRLQIGDRGSDVLPPEPPASFLTALMRTNPRPSANDTVLNIRPTAMAVTWMAINQSLDKSEAAKRTRPPQFFSGPDLSRLQLIRGQSDGKPRVGEKFTLRDPSYAETHGVTPSIHGKEGVDGGVVTVYALMVKETRSRVTVLWQDGSRADYDAKTLIPYLNVDEYDCWPGDYVLHKTEDSKRVAVVQTVNAADRTALIRYRDNNATELVSVLELDPHGTSTTDGGPSGQQLDSFGVRRGDFVFVHRMGTTNGAELPRVPKIGELEGWVREIPTIEDKPDGTTVISGWRGELHNIGQAIAKARGTPESAGRELDGRVKKMGSVGGINWFGEVTNLRTDGQIEVMLGSMDTIVVPLERLTRLQDGMDNAMADMWGDEYSEEHGFDGDEDGDVEIQYENGSDAAWERYDGDFESADEWEDVADGGDDWNSAAADVVSNGDITVDQESGIAEEVMEVDLPGAQVGVESPPVNLSVPLVSDIAEISSGPSSGVRSPAEIDIAAKKAKDVEDDEDEDVPWQRFIVLPQAPVDHAFYSSKSAQTTKTFMARLNKEYRVLKSSLPESILVRAYEDRADLLRCLIIGPENTPYEDAPFVIDWLLDSDFPQTPPQAHFLSWTNGNGRVNPNLYEEGKVCLSILGTWAGDRNESWSAARSSLLQAFVSIQGLVLVKEPWFCEPAYEKLRNTEEGFVNSRLYSEKAYVLSRGFVRRALEIPLGGLESEIKWFYYERKRLQEVIREAHGLIEKSKQTEGSGVPTAALMSDRAVPRLSAGGALMLSRTLAKLEALWQARTRTSSVPGGCP
ncbi:hypothetical protein K439DRAFT_1419556 [Ramaria rubella]|nr:hypothetical protein K439DRAFT_1419556 [Ramaria rubella]